MASLEHHTQTDHDLLFDLWQSSATRSSFPSWELPEESLQGEYKHTTLGHCQGFHPAAAGLPGGLLLEDFLDSAAVEAAPLPEAGDSGVQDLWLQDGFSGSSTCDQEPWTMNQGQWTMDSLLQGDPIEASTRRDSGQGGRRSLSPTLKPMLTSCSHADLSTSVTPMGGPAVDSLIDELLAENWGNDVTIRGYASPSQETGEAFLVPAASCTEGAPLSVEDYEVLLGSQEQESHGNLQEPSLPSSTEESTVPEEHVSSARVAASSTDFEPTHKQTSTFEPTQQQSSAHADQGSLAGRLAGVLNSIAKQKHARRMAAKQFPEASTSGGATRDTCRLQSGKPAGFHFEATGGRLRSSVANPGKEWGGRVQALVPVKAESTVPAVLAGQDLKRRSGDDSSAGSETLHTSLSPTADPLLRQPRRTWRYAMASRFLDPHYRKQVVGELMQLATLYSTNQMGSAHKQLIKLRKVAFPDGTVTQRLTHYMLEGLMARFEGEQRLASLEPPAELLNSSFMSNVKLGINRVWGRFSEAAMTSAILSALRGRDRVHVIVLTTCCTPDWDDLFAGLKASLPTGQELQARASFVIPCIGPATLQDLQKEYKSFALTQQAVAAAERAGVRIQASELFLSPREFRPGLVQARVGEAVAVAAWLALQAIPDDSVLRHNPRDLCLKWIRDLSPEVFVMVEMDADFNSPFFLSRFKQVLHRGEALLENLEATVRSTPDPGSVFVGMCIEGVLSLDLINCVACDGLARFERAEPAAKWADRMQALSFGKSPAEAEMRAPLEGLCLHPRLRLVECTAGSQLLWDDSPILFVQAWRGPVASLSHPLV